MILEKLCYVGVHSCGLLNIVCIWKKKRNLYQPNAILWLEDSLVSISFLPSPYVVVVVVVVIFSGFANWLIIHTRKNGKRNSETPDPIKYVPTPPIHGVRWWWMPIAKLMIGSGNRSKAMQKTTILREGPWEHRPSWPPTKFWFSI